jgi:branched-subunit amino acid ABC-type transport system permease component
MGMIICGFGMSVALVNVAYFIWGAEAEPFRANLDYIPRLQFPGDIEVPESYVLTAIISVVLMAGLHYFLRHTKTGPCRACGRPQQGYSPI